MNKKKIIYTILKEIEKGENLLKFSDLSLSLIEFRDLIDLIQDDDLIKGASLSKSGQDPAQIVRLNKATITLKGLNYLEQNSSFAQTYPGLAELKPWLRL